MFANGNTNILGFSSQSVLFVTVILMYAGMRSILRYILLVSYQFCLNFKIFTLDFFENKGPTYL